MGQERDKASESKTWVLGASPPHLRLLLEARRNAGEKECAEAKGGWRVCGHRGWQHLSLGIFSWQERPTLLGMENNSWQLAPEALRFLTIHHYYPPCLALAWCRGETETGRKAGSLAKFRI